ncbi:MAG TPA: AAA family ATPase [Solirubrobacteraceae bacterium]|nr:AAA family ATPase [Solirubrobacteraceae bacterium]
MADELPPVGPFATEFVAFVHAMHEAAELPEGPWVASMREHLGVEPAEQAITSASFRIAERANLQLALEDVLQGVVPLGVPSHQGMAGLLGGAHPGPRRNRGWAVEWADVEIGDGRVLRCMRAALLLVQHEQAPVALLVCESEGQGPGMFGPQTELRLEAISPDQEAVSSLFAAIRRAMLEHNIFRGKIISLTSSGGVGFHNVPEVTQADVVLPDGVLDRLRQHAIGISEHAGELRAAGRHLKRGILLHGPPGTGKTLTINYLLNATRGRTTVLLSGGGLGHLESAFGIARDLAPATVVLEDVDLVAAERFTRASGGLLFELLNQLEGLEEDVDLLTVLTTNRPDVIEPALAARPGRVDLALEAPLPDDACRTRLLHLYAREIPLDERAVSELAEITEGVTGAFIKELMRQATLRAALAGRSPGAGDVKTIAEELLDERATLTRRLLGHGPGDSADLGEPPPSMGRAVIAAGLVGGPVRRVVQRP